MDPKPNELRTWKYSHHVNKIKQQILFFYFLKNTKYDESKLKLISLKKYEYNNTSSLKLVKYSRKNMI